MKPRLYSELTKDIMAGIILSAEEWQRTREFEKSLIPDDYVMPIEGAIYVCAEDCQADFEIFWNAAGSGGCEEISIPKGEEVKIGKIWEAKQVIIPAVPVDYSRMEQILVPAKERSTPKYGGFGYAIYTRNFIAKFRKK